MKKFCALFALLPLVAVAQQEPPAFRIGDCYKEMWSDSRSALVIARLGFGQDPIPLSLRASKATANAKEKESLEFVAAAMQKCQQLDQQNRATYHPMVKQAVDEYETGYRSVLTRVYSGDMAWGAAIEANESNQSTFERRKQELLVMAEAQQKADAERQALAEEQRKAALRADFERQQRADAQQRYIEQQRQEQANREITNGLLLLNAARPQPRPMMPSTSCSSRNVGGTVYTDCR